LPLSIKYHHIRKLSLIARKASRGCANDRALTMGSERTTTV
jgi:hypothetical protein